MTRYSGGAVRPKGKGAHQHRGRLVWIRVYSGCCRSNQRRQEMFEPSIEKLEAEVSALRDKESAMLARKQAALDAVGIAEDSAGALYLDEPEQAIAGIDAAVTRANSEGKAV